MDTPASPRIAAARRRHRRHLRPRPGAGRGLRRARRRGRLRRPSRRRGGVASPAASRAATASSATSRARRTPTRSRCRSVPPSAASTSWSTTPRASGRCRCALLADTECEDFEAALATNLLGPFRLTKALLGAARRRSARRRRDRHALAGAQRLQRRRGHALCRLGRVWREQGGAGAPRPDLGRGAPAARRRASSPSIRATWTRRSMRSPFPTPTRRRLKRPGDAARELVARIDRERAGRAARRCGARHEGRDAAGAAAARRPPPASSTRGGRIAAHARGELPELLRRRRHRRRQRRGDPAGEPERPSPRERRGDRGAPRRPRLLARRSRRGAALSRRRLRRRRFPHPHRGPAAAAAARAGRRAARSGRCAPTVVRTLGHPRLVELRFAGDADAIHAGIARHGRPVQYAHLAEPLALWDVWTRIAGPPVAFEPPSAGFVLDWHLLDALRRRGIGFATLTHAAGLSSTGDPALDARLPFDEPYRLPASAVTAIEAAKARGGRVVAHRHHRRPRPRARCRAAGRPRARRRRGDPAARAVEPPRRRRCPRQRHARAGHQPSRAAAGLRRRRRRWRGSTPPSKAATGARTSSATRSGSNGAGLSRAGT